MSTPLTVQEEYDSPKWTYSDSDSLELSYKVFSATDADTAGIAAFQRAMSDVTLPRYMTWKETSVNPIEKLFHTDSDGILRQAWIVTLKFGKRDPLDYDYLPTYNCSTQKVSYKATQSLNYTVLWQADRNAILSQKLLGLVGWDGEKFNGYDRTFPLFTWTETHKFPAKIMNQSYRGTMSSMTDTINAYPFRGWPAKCVRFDNFSATYDYITKRRDQINLDSEGVWTCSYTFSASLPQEGKFISYAKQRREDDIHYSVLTYPFQLTERRDVIAYKWGNIRMDGEGEWIQGWKSCMQDCMLAFDVYFERNFDLLGLPTIPEWVV
jgi:hypothetical protein